MAYTITYNPATRTVEAIVQGTISFGELNAIFAEAIQSLAEHDSYLYLADYTEATISASTIELYNLPKTLASAAIPYGYSVHKLRRTIVIRENTPDFLFYETVTLNRGQSTKLFYDMDAAKEWLAVYPEQMGL